MQTQDIRKEFGKKVRFYRSQRGLTQGELAEQVERTEDTISNIERGISSTRIETAAKIATALGVPLTELFDFPFYKADRKKFLLINELMAIALDQDESWLKACITHLQNLSELAVSPKKQYKSAGKKRKRKVCG